MIDFGLGLADEGIFDKPLAKKKRDEPADDDDNEEAEDKLRSEGELRKMHYSPGCECSHVIILYTEWPFKATPKLPIEKRHHERSVVISLTYDEIATPPLGLAITRKSTTSVSIGGARRILDINIYVFVLWYVHGGMMIFRINSPLIMFIIIERCPYSK